MAGVLPTSGTFISRKWRAPWPCSVWMLTARLVNASLMTFV